MDDLRRFPQISRTHFIECSGNTAPGWNALGTTVQFSHGLASCSVWTGLRLRDVLDEAGTPEDGTWLVVEGLDGAAYQRSIPMSKVRDDALLVYGQNGEALRPEQGYPLRLVLPGFEGSANVKWVHRLEVRRAPAYARDETARYAIERPDGKRVVFDLAMPVKSVIVDPSPGRRLERGTNELRGLAWSGAGSIAHVEVTVDDGTTWVPATLDSVSPRCFTRFTLPLRWSGAPLRLASRATDDTGQTQPTAQQFVAARGAGARYHVNRIQTWDVAATGDITAGTI
jgi:sulfane dehydrogenase subunit SoxC